MSDTSKLKMYKKAYMKCIKSCSKFNDENDGGKKNCCRSPFLKFNFSLKKSVSKKKSKSPKKLNEYQKFVKNEYKKYQNTGLSNTLIMKEIALSWKNKKQN